MSKDKTKAEYDMEKLKLILGFALIVFMISIHVWVKELPIWMMAIPGFLMGFDPREWVKLNSKK